MGCAKNEVDTNDMRHRLENVGFKITDNLSDSDIVIVNTCSFIQAAVEESIDMILDVINDEYVNTNDIPLIVAGCMPSRYGEDLAGEIPEAASFVPCAKEDDIAKIACACLGLDFEAMTKKSSQTLEPSNNTSHAIEESSAGSDANGQAETFAYLKISDGCDRFCSYCTIPYIRGRYHSFPLEEIRKRVKSYADEGYKEIVLIGQDTGLWGKDLDANLDLSLLLDTLAKEFPDIWFRVMYTQPENVSDKLLDVMALHSNIAPYLDIPFQHCTESILSDMNRKGSFGEYIDLIRKARSVVPEIAIRTTLMVGFPGESDSDFEELLRFVEEAEFEYVGVFSYSQEEGTKAASFDDQVDDDEKLERYAKLRDVCDSISNVVIARRRGSKLEVLIEGVEEDGQLFGRAIIQAPEVDGITFIDLGDIGQFYRCVIEDTLFYNMEASST